MIMAKPKSKESSFRRIYEVSVNYYYPQRELETEALREVTIVTVQYKALLIQKIVNADRNYNVMRLEAEVKKEAVETIYRKLPKALWVDVTNCELRIEIENKEGEENGRA